MKIYRMTVLGIFSSIAVMVLVFHGCEGGGEPPVGDPGLLVIFISEKPAPGLESLCFTVSRVDVVRTETLGGKEEVLTLQDEPETLEFFGLHSFIPYDFGEYWVPDGYVVQIRFIIEEGSGSAVLDGEEMTATIPSGPQTGIKAITKDVEIEIKDEHTTSVTLEFDLEKSIHTNQGKGMMVKPVIEAKLGKVGAIALDEHIPHQLLVSFNAGVTQEEIDDLNAEIGAEIKHQFHDTNVFHVQLPTTTTVEEAQTFYAESDLVKGTCPDFVLVLATTPSDPDFWAQWALHNEGQVFEPYYGTSGTWDADIDAPDAWNLQTGNPNLIIAVIDTGVKRDHYQLAPNMWENSAEVSGTIGVDDDGNGYTDDKYGWHFWTEVVDSTPVHMEDNDITDLNGHGTEMAGIIGALGNDGQAMTGVMWNVKIMPIKVTKGTEGLVNLIDWVKAVEYAVLNGAAITNSSIAKQIFKNRAEEIQSMYDDIVGGYDILNVVAAGNANMDIDADPHYWYPAELNNDNILTVMASDYDDAVAIWAFGASNRGMTSVDIAAPGSWIYTTSRTDALFKYVSGTSAAAPIVAGVAGLILSEYPGLIGNPVAVKQRILDNSDHPFWLLNTSVTSGRVNAYKALR